MLSPSDIRYFESLLVDALAVEKPAEWNRDNDSLVFNLADSFYDLEKMKQECLMHSWLCQEE